ncbi:antibiotic biosynthesis monooxygenase [Pseudomonas fluorescens]|uniref:Antibiotic biosynthesis monooxygenase n=1 Tax=Pseudomonas fluorescens TaxID=294 RepID=A0A944HGN3_PSEFL|nr:antibiotic biosynthesis monooxygenase [Pseudomonas fluorescens]MBT2311732.1 antibiotic biosynthesis monooxygenase [Pseudomonas fluorescens]MBT2316683.1 antibiotic biosynthesis monooxygenase [Pseudomonas fluorescens]MBT2329889.1 antibiotic biosynthesis monooxygenase [Pseudomonas fluorescens]MBT2344502.1 antibiotic biosynthesis monooxygenase [Pseudomonas fluorescens]MBT2348108.1 antibiotic biosynthesis monooxygenase [Pseudomonas fluorescens]
MSTSPVTLMVARRVAHGRYQDLIAWLREGEQLATDFPGYLGSGVLAPPPQNDEFQIIFRFADEQTLHAWEHSASRTAWLARGSELFADPSEHRVRGIDGWFGAGDQRPPRWKQAVAIWLAFFPVSLLFNFLLGPLLSELGMMSRVLISTLILTPLMVYLFIPMSTHLLADWLNGAAPKALPAKPSTQNQ